VAVLGEDGAEIEIVLDPPVDVLFVAERTDHHRAGPELAVDVVVGDQLDLVAEKRHLKRVADPAFVALVVGIDGHRDTGGEQFGPRGGDLDVVVADPLEGDIVQRPIAVLVFDFGVGDRCLTPGTPVDGVFVLVDVARIGHLDERPLGLAPVVVVHRPELVVPVL